MPRPLIVALAALFTMHTSACDRGGFPAPPTDTPSAEAGAPLLGKAAYERVCGDCHDRGLDGAPRVGDRAAWAGRSPLWEAVLYEHAKQGYLDMPAMGGATDLRNSEVEAAAEYMLSLTHPELAPDAR